MNVIVIDDEKMARLNLIAILHDYCPELTVVAECDDLPSGVKAIRKLHPQLVLLDIEMPGHSGLELLDFFDENEVDFNIIFTTAYNEYAIKAFKLSAIDYLLKPISPTELENAVKRALRQNMRFESIKALKQNIHQPQNMRIAIPSGSTLIFINTSDILYVKGEGAYSEVYMSDNTVHVVSRNLKNFEMSLDQDDRFIRVHKSYLVNFDHLSKYNKADGGSLVLFNSTLIPISPDKVPLVIDKIQLVKR